MADRLMLVFTNPVEGQDDAYNEWYEHHHLKHVLNVPGIVAAQRYNLAQQTLPEGEDLPAQLPPPAHRHLAIYELDRDPDDVMSDFLSRVGTDVLPLSDTLDLTTVSLATWEAKGARHVADGLTRQQSPAI